MHHGVRVRVFFVGRRRTTGETTAVAAAHLGVTTYMFFSHIRTRYFSEGSVQQHPPPYSFRKRVGIKNKTPSMTNHR